MSNVADGTLYELIEAALRSVHDPEIPVNIYDLGLIYTLDIDDNNRVHIDMTLTAPNCPVADQIVNHVQQAVRGVEGVKSADVNLVWQPAWSPERMSEIAQLELEAMGIDPRRAKETAGKMPTTLTVRGQSLKDR